LPLRGPGDGAAVGEGRVPQYGTPVLGHVAVWFCVCVALRWAACLDVCGRWAVCAREMVEGPLDGLPMSVPEVGCNTGHLRVGVDTAHLAESLRDWARLVCVWLLLDGLLPGRPVGAAHCLRKRARVRRTSVCYLRGESRLCAVGVYEWCRRTAFYRCHSPCFVWVFREGPRGLQAGREARGVGARLHDLF